jgi:hypothetical protein
MDIADKERLIKLIGMLGSSHDGERANAAAFLQKMAAKYKMTITELMAQVGGKGQDRVIYKDRIVEKVVVKEVFRDRPGSPFGFSNEPPKPEPEPSFTDVDSPLLQRMKDVAAKPAIASRVLTQWELNFITDVSSRYEYDRELSDKQLVIVERVLVKASRLFTW